MTAASVVCLPPPPSLSALARAASAEPFFLFGAPTTVHRHGASPAAPALVAEATLHSDISGEPPQTNTWRSCRHHTSSPRHWPRVLPKDHSGPKRSGWNARLL